MIMKIVSARGPDRPILKCHMVSVSNEKSLKASYGQKSLDGFTLEIESNF